MEIIISPRKLLWRSTTRSHLHLVSPQVWTDKYRLLLKSNGWGGSGKKCPKNWGERETTILELGCILGRSYLTQVVAKKSDVVEGESVTAVTVG